MVRAGRGGAQGGGGGRCPVRRASRTQHRTGVGGCGGPPAGLSCGSTAPTLGSSLLLSLCLLKDGLLRDVDRPKDCDDTAVPSVGPDELPSSCI
jgi:hypothetical protein